MSDSIHVDHMSMEPGRAFEQRCQFVLQAEWGSITLIDALRKLLNAALRDKLNQKMLLLSESGVPLFAPQLIYSQILFESGSRLDSCGIWVGSLAPA